MSAKNVLSMMKGRLESWTVSGLMICGRLTGHGSGGFSAPAGSRERSSGLALLSGVADILKLGRLAQLGRAPPLQGEGSRVRVPDWLPGRDPSG